LDTFELNKIAGAFLGTLLFAMWLNVISSAIFTPAKLVKPGYPLPRRKKRQSAGNGAPAPAIAPIEDRLAKADGEKKARWTQSPAKPAIISIKEASPRSVRHLRCCRPAQSHRQWFHYSDAIKSKGGK